MKKLYYTWLTLEKKGEKAVWDYLKKAILFLIFEFDKETCIGRKNLGSKKLTLLFKLSK